QGFQRFDFTASVHRVTGDTQRPDHDPPTTVGPEEVTAMSNRNRFIRRVAVGAAALAVLAAAGCGAATTTGGGGEQAAASVEEGFTIGLLLPDAKTARYEKFDRPYFEEAIAELCPKCEVTYQNADQDVSKQQSQAEA